MRRGYAAFMPRKPLDALEGGYAHGCAGDGFLPSPASASRRVRGLGQRPRVCEGSASASYVDGAIVRRDFDAVLGSRGVGGAGVRSEGPLMRIVMQRC